VVAAALLAAACSSPSPGPSGSPSPSSPAPTTSSASPSPSTSEPSPSLTGAGTAPVERPPGDGGFGLLVDARLAGHEGFDRFVLEFLETVPGYRVAYVDKPVIADPSGETVEVAGDHVLWIRLEPSSGFDLLDRPDTPTYTGPARLSSDTEVVTEAVLTGDFEAVLSWVLGMEGEHPFVVTELESPPRLVIDVATS
jgi:hypothetical protein